MTPERAYSISGGVTTQLALLDRATAPAADPTFAGVHRRDLGQGAWLDHGSAWLVGHQPLMDDLVAGMAWRSASREMYGEPVAVPRLLGRVPEDGPGHPILSDLSALLTRRYGRCLTDVSLALYRDGRDSVAPHADRVGRDRIDDSVVAILSLGVPRRFRLKPVGPGASLHFTLGWGDLLVLGGSCQRHWLHGVPKARRTHGPRMSVMFREARPAGAIAAR